jgi:hypothetical protein
MNALLRDNPHRPPYRDPDWYQPRRSLFQDLAPQPPAASTRPSLSARNAKTTVFQRHDGLQAWAEYTLDVAQRVDPGLASRPFYVVRMDMQNLRGASGPGLFRTFEREIKAAGKNFGVGPTIVADLKAKYMGHFSAATEAGLDSDTADEHAKRSVSGLLLHETGHVIRDNEFGQSPPIGGNAAASRAGFEQWVNGPPPADQSANPETQVAWAKHDAPFLRTICHLWARAKQHIPGLKPDDLIPSDLYGLSQIHKYVDALRPELSATGAIEDVVFHSRPPREFVELWRSDVRAWLAGIPEPTAGQTQAALDGLKLYKYIRLR